MKTYLIAKRRKKHDMSDYIKRLKRRAKRIESGGGAKTARYKRHGKIVR